MKRAYLPMLLLIIAMLLLLPPLALGSALDAASEQAAVYPVDSVVPEEPFWQDSAAVFLTSGIVRTILLTLGIAGIVIEILSLGSFGLFGAMGIMGFGLYFIGNFFSGSLGAFPLLLLAGGVALLLLEIFITTGFGVPGVLGIMAILVSLVMATPNPVNAIWSVLIALTLSGFIIYFTLKNKKTRKVWGKLILFQKSDSEGGYVSADPLLTRFAGKSGRAVTILRPAGVAEIDGEQADVVTRGEFIEAGALIEVMQIEGMRVVVRRLRTEQDAE